MSGLVKILIGVFIGLILVVSAATFAPHTVDNQTTDTGLFGQIQDSVDSLNTNGNFSISTNNTTYTVSSSNNNNNSNGNPVISGSSEFNSQAGEGNIYQINYKDGNFRQYDTNSGELIGSSFDEDQEKLGVVNGELI